MNDATERRRAPRVRVHVPATVEVLGGLPAHGGLDTGYERLVVPAAMAGARFAAIIEDLSTTGARLGASELPPLLSRLSVVFSLPGHERALAACVVMWRREKGATSSAPAGALPESASFGVSFEALDLGVRKCIADMVSRDSAGV
jgi:PilZ domain